MILRSWRKNLLAAGWLLSLACGSVGESAEHPRIEIFSRGGPEGGLFIKRDALLKIKFPQPVKINERVAVTHGAVGYMEKDSKNGGYLFVPANEVPLKTGTQFGWLLMIDSKLDEIEVVEEFSLPRKNQTWNVDADQTKISQDGLTATTTDNRWFWNFLWRVWTLEEGDPDGMHKFKIRLAGKVAGEFAFEIKKTSK
ncbi:MAG: hypothetical protein ACR2OZ_16840 [Verrucomicrobiales bacterium]